MSRSKFTHGDKIGESDANNLMIANYCENKLKKKKN
jgi:hypothetical protein